MPGGWVNLGVEDRFELLSAWVGMPGSFKKVLGEETAINALEDVEIEGCD